jgi:outer membrane protein TolC
MLLSFKLTQSQLSEGRGEILMTYSARTREPNQVLHCHRGGSAGGINGFVYRVILFATGVILAIAGVAFQTRAQKTSPSAENQPRQEAQVQLLQPPGANNATAPVTITLQDAIERARKNDVQFLAAVNGAKSAHEDRLQARNAILPQFSYTTQALLTQGNGKTPNGRFVTNDGVHVYRAWAVAHEDLSPANYLGTTYNRAKAAEAVANATAEIAKRGLTVAVTKLYYAMADSQRKYATAQEALDTAKTFYNNTQDAERVGQAAHSDVIQAEIQYRQLEQAYQEASLAMESARLDLAVLLFPTLNENFSVVDDLDNPVALPPFAEAERMAAHENPELRVAMEELRSANSEVTAAKGRILYGYRLRNRS